MNVNVFLFHALGGVVGRESRDLTAKNDECPDEIQQDTPLPHSAYMPDSVTKPGGSVSSVGKPKALQNDPLPECSRPEARRPVR